MVGISSQPLDRKQTWFIDTNVLSHIANGRAVDFLGFLTDNSVQLVTSDEVLAELWRGRPAAEQRLIDTNDFSYLGAHEPIFLEGKVNFYRNPPDPIGDGSEPIEKFLNHFLRSASGSPSVPELSTLLSASIFQILDALCEPLAENADPRIKLSWSKSREKIQESLGDLPKIESPFIDNQTSKMLLIWRDKFRSVTPPDILGKISKIVGNDALDILKNSTRQIEVHEDLKPRIEEFLLALVLLGFERESRLPSGNENKSMQGAVSQFSDFHHISTAIACDVFVTADKNCAKLAYAAYETFGLRTQVAYASANPEEPTIRQVGIDFWPS